MAFNDPGGDGVAGWLAFFVVVIGLLSPLRILISVYSGLYGDPAAASFFAEVWTRLQAFEWTMAALSIAGCWYIVWRLFNVQRWSTVRVTIVGIWLLGVGLLLVDSLGAALIAGISPGVVMAEIPPQELVQPLIFGSIWTAYFLLSKRVANTYPRHPEHEELREPFE